MDARLFELPEVDDDFDVQIVTERKAQGGHALEEKKDQEKDAVERSGAFESGPRTGQARVSPVDVDSLGKEKYAADSAHKVTPLPQDMEKMLNEHKDQLRIWDEKIQKEKASSSKGGGAAGGSLRGFLSQPSTGFSQVQAETASNSQANPRRPATPEDRSGKIGRGIKNMFGTNQKK
mmetsp:Transcript_1346/g.3691  ORF Transcript_1346/g.3691 Transcript_1346/m.3691 type:complete len:177 (-) Transcript_1346:57-587(-)|eukprot:CAMPEP_0185837334 /NCGR_PEP_ID=MMETSP1353-20130828/11210_1 /TAXON_ID=1077150 /ORGANISM="Erythrolobus australicus, Strain CCMP3124" /LENGTH=176 /DNA_ID=CAMNT_0028536237 /DNA_START=566 /DNA_END=1096 /DNA_ORIENTATION=+